MTPSQATIHKVKLLPTKTPMFTILTDHGVAKSEADASHTELGIRNGKKGKYPQAREFDEKGKPVRDIDFTDHGYPKQHPNPHQHRAAPVPEWRY